MNLLQHILGLENRALLGDERTNGHSREVVGANLQGERRRFVHRRASYPASLYGPYRTTCTGTIPRPFETIFTNDSIGKALGTARAIGVIMNKLNAALLALSFTALSTVIGCSAPIGDSSEVPSAAEVTRSTKRHSVVVGEDHEIVARRDALRPKKSFGVKALGSEVLTAPAKFVRSSGTVVANPRTDGALTIALARNVTGAPAAVAAGGVVSSDPSVATATVAGAELTVTLTGKLGNTFLTTFDAAGNATAKVMVLSALPMPGTAIVDDEALEPSALQLGTYGVPEQLATDFADRTNDQALASLYAATPGSNDRIGAMTFANQETYRSFAKAAIDAVGMGPSGVRAIYFPKKDLLVTTVRGDLSGLSLIHISEPTRPY